MNIWPMAPQAANERMAGRIAGLRFMKARAAVNSEPVVELVGLRGAVGRRGERRR